MTEHNIATPFPARLFLTKAEAAAALSIGRTKLNELVALGDVPSVRIGRAVRIPTAGLAAYAERLVASQKRVA